MKVPAARSHFAKAAATDYGWTQPHVDINILDLVASAPLHPQLDKESSKKEEEEAVSEHEDMPEENDAEIGGDAAEEEKPSAG